MSGNPFLGAEGQGTDLRMAVPVPGNFFSLEPWAHGKEITGHRHRPLCAELLQPPGASALRGLSEERPLRISAQGFGSSFFWRSRMMHMRT